jgi:hypothetical protein
MRRLYIAMFHLNDQQRYQTSIQNLPYAFCVLLAYLQVWLVPSGGFYSFNSLWVLLVLALCRLPASALFAFALWTDSDFLLTCERWSCNVL